MPHPATEQAPPPSFKRWRQEFWSRVLTSTDRGWRLRLMAATVVMVAAIGIADFYTGFLLSLLVFYLLPVCLAVAAEGPRFGVAIAFACVGTWLAGDLAAGAHYPTSLVPAWNAGIALVTYLIVVWLLSNLMSLHREMDERITQRTLALKQEIAERERLEKVLLQIGEREQRSVGRDLAGGLRGHLAKTSERIQALAARLESEGNPESRETAEIATSLETGITQANQLARGLLSAEIRPEELSRALTQLAEATRLEPGIECRCQADTTVVLADTATSTHLYRIAQEAVRNALRHAGASRIDLSLRAAKGKTVLGIRDNGRGLPPPRERGKGLGLQIMAHRASIIGARFSIEAQPDGGTLVECILANPGAES